MEETLNCSICLEIFKDPVILTCTHSFCSACLKRTWNQKEMKECPLCRKKIKRLPLNNLTLKETCETFTQAKKCRISTEPNAVICLLHAEIQQLYCMDDRQLVCLQCVNQDHKTHNFCSIGKAATDQRTKLEESLQVLQTKLNTLTSKKSNDTCTFLQSKRNVEVQIKGEFVKLHEFLNKEEKVRLAALNEEEKEKFQWMKVKTAEMEMDLSEQIRDIKDALRVEDSLFVNNFKESEKRAEYTMLDPVTEPGAQIDVTKHLGNLRYRVWEKMKDICS